MTDRARSRMEEGSVDESRPEPAVPEAVETTEAYETDDGVVLYDAENPLAWLQAEASAAVTVRDEV